MPELPEVETIARGLAPQLVGRTITGVDVRYAGATRDQADFAARVVGRRVESVTRRAKLLLLSLSDDMTIVCHLKMTGRLVVHDPQNEPDQHTHVVFDLDDGRRLHFRDVRKFGYIRALTGAELEAWDFFAGLGPEPLEMSAEDFARSFKRRNAMVKALLLNQEAIAGVGNIYADEALFGAKIHPASKASAVSDRRLKKLHAALVAVLVKSIAENGSSIRDYVTAGGDAGSFQNNFRVYGKAGEPCPRCGRELRAEKVAGRTSTFCPGCQKRRT